MASRIWISYIPGQQNIYSRQFPEKLSIMQIVTATGQQGHNSGPARDTIAGQKLSQYPARKGAFHYNGRTSFSEEESIIGRSVY